MPNGVTGTLFDTHSTQIEEIINKNVDTILPTLDPAWRDTIVTSQGVGPASAIGRDLKILKIYRGGLTGVVEQARPRNDFVLYGDATATLGLGDKMYTQSVNQVWPSAMDGPVNRPYRLGVNMRAMLTNLAITMGELTAEATPAFIGDVIAPKLKGFAQNMAHTLCNYWYVSQNDGYCLAYTTSYVGFDGNATNAIPTGEGRLVLTVGNGAVDRFFVGQRVDLYTDSSGAAVRINDSATTTATQNLGTRKNLYVGAVDELKGQVTIVGPKASFTNSSDSVGLGATATGTAGTDKLWITYANSRTNASTTLAGFTGIAGINSWMKFGDGNGATSNKDNTLLGAEYDSANYINVNVHPEFKSFQQTSVGTLTEHKLRQYIRRFHAAKNKYGQSIDCLIAADGVWLNYEAQKIGQYQLQRAGALSSLSNEGSEEGFKFTFEGRTYNGYTSTYIEDGVVYGIKKGGSNWKRYVPPAPQGVQAMSEAESFIPFNFVVPALTGTASTKWPVLTASGQLTEAMQMPGMIRMQLVPDQAAGLKLSGCSYDKVYSS
jgi:hypothetical protein